MFKDKCAAQVEVNRAVLDVIQRQIDRNEEIIRGILFSWDRLFTVGLLIFGGAITLGLKDNREEVLLALPMAIGVVLSLGYMLGIEMLARGGYNKYLEEIANKRLHTNVLLWESRVAPSTSHRAINNNIILPFIYLFFLLFSCYLALTKVHEVPRLHPWKLPVYFEVGFVTLAFMVENIEMIKIRKRGYGTARASAQG